MIRFDQKSFRFRQAPSSGEAFWLIRKSVTMYRREKPLLLKGSTSALANNLSIEVNLDKGTINYATVHKSLVNLVSASVDGSSVNPRQIPCKEPSAAQGFTMILQVNVTYTSKIQLTCSQKIAASELDSVDYNTT